MGNLVRVRLRYRLRRLVFVGHRIINLLCARIKFFSHRMYFFTRDSSNVCARKSLGLALVLAKVQVTKLPALCQRSHLNVFASLLSPLLGEMTQPISSVSTHRVALIRNPTSRGYRVESKLPVNSVDLCVVVSIFPVNLCVVVSIFPVGNKLLL